MTGLESFFFIIGLVFGGLAGMIAFLITLNEWHKHQFTGWKLWREPLVRGIFTFVFFFALSMLIGWAL